MRYTPAPWLLMNKANARLIDAAPALLAACHAFIEAHTQHTDGRARGRALYEAYSAAQAAIAKAVQS